MCYDMHRCISHKLNDHVSTDILNTVAASQSVTEQMMLPVATDAEKTMEMAKRVLSKCQPLVRMAPEQLEIVFSGLTTRSFMAEEVR